MNDATAHASTRAERRSARLNHPRFDRFRSTTARRRLVVALAAVFLLEGATVALTEAAQGPVGVALAFGVLLVLVGPFLFCLTALKASTRGVEDLGPVQLDERQLQVRGVVYAQAYKIGSSLVCALFCAAALWSIVAETYPPSLLILGVAVVAWQLALVLPTMVAAWHERI